LDEEELKILKSVWDGYKKFSGSQLSEITHRHGSPWSTTWEKNKFGIIPLDEIKSYYTKIVTPNH